MTACPHCREIQEERAAIHQYDGGATREQADALAATERCQLHKTGKRQPVPVESRICTFHCYDCGVEAVFDIDKVDPTTSTGCCRDCGSNKWKIFGPDGEQLE